MTLKLLRLCPLGVLLIVGCGSQEEAKDARIAQLEAQLDSLRSSILIPAASGQAASPSARVVAPGSANQELHAAGSGFFYKQVRFSDQGDGLVEVVGELVNQSGKDYTTALFNLNVYSKDGQLLAVTPVMLSSSEAGSTKSFTALFTESFPQGFTYKLEFSIAD